MIESRKDVPLTALGRRVTLQDVARQAGVSRSTASKVLNDRSDSWASAAVRARILETARTLDYRPNLSARALRSGRTHLLGFVSPGFGVQSPRSRAGGLTEAAVHQAYTVALASHANDDTSEDQTIRRLVDRGVDGIAVYPVDTATPARHAALRALVARGFPIVTFDGATLLDFACDDISVDYREVGRLQARHLLERGKQRICLVGTRPQARSNTWREEGALEVLREAGAPEPLRLYLPRPATVEHIDANILEPPLATFLARQRGAFDGVIGHDVLVSIMIRVLLRAGLRVPADVALVGAGNGMLASHGAVPFTSISTADDQAGARAFALLHQRIAAGASKPFAREFQPIELIVRESTGG